MPVPADIAFTPEELHAADELGMQLVRLMRVAAKAKSVVAKHGPDGIERSAYILLYHLATDGPQRTSKLAELVQSEISTISRQTRTLVEHGLVERRADPEDGRACLLCPTDEGLRVLEENRRNRNQRFAQVMADWPETDRHTLTELLARFVTGMEQQIPQFIAEQNSAEQSEG